MHSEMAFWLSIKYFLSSGLHRLALRDSVIILMGDQ